MPTYNLRRVKNRIKQNLLRVGQLSVEFNNHEESLRLLNESLRNLMRIRTQMNEDKFDNVKRSIEQLMTIITVENPSVNTNPYYSSRESSGK